MNFGESLNKLGESSESVKELVSSKKETIIKQGANLFLLLIILLVFGCFDFLHLTFHWEYLIDPNFWISVGTKAIADICAYNIGINVIIDELIKRNTTLCILKTNYDNLNKYKEHDFETYITLYNRECKITQYKNDINYKIYKLNKRAKHSDKILYSNDDENSNSLKLSNRYCVKRLELEQLKTDEYIEKNIDTLEVRYVDVDPAVFDLEINGSQKIIQNKITGSLNKGRAIASITTLAGVIIAPIIINSFALDPNRQEFEDGVIAGVNYALKMASDIGILIWQFLRGILSTHKIVSQQLTIPLEERVKILKKYYKWRKDTGKSVPQCYEDLFKEVKYVELSEEELKQIKKL